jgi:hypothetical protein
VWWPKVHACDDDHDAAFAQSLGLSLGDDWRMKLVMARNKYSSSAPADTSLSILGSIETGNGTLGSLMIGFKMKLCAPCNEIRKLVDHCA